MSNPNFKYYQQAKQFHCNSCGGTLTLINRRTQYVGCPYCGSVADARSEAYQVIKQLEKPTKYPYFSFIRLGMQGVLNNKQFQIIGRTRFGMDYWEFDSESKSYERTTWEYDEWLLMQEDGAYSYLIEDQEGIKLSETLIPQNPSLPQNDMILDFAEKKQQKVEEYGKVWVQYFEGESTYDVRINDQHDFWQYKAYGATYIAEGRKVNPDSLEYIELSFYKEKNLYRSDLNKMFGEDAQYQAMIKKALSRNTHRAVNRVLFALGAVVFFVFWIQSFLGDMVFRQEIQLKDFKLISLTDSFQTFAITSQDFDLKNVDRVYGLVVEMEMPTNQDCGLEIEVLDSKGESVNFLEQEFYKSSGYDGGEYWEENNNTITEHYWLDEAGKYKINLTAQLPNTWAADQFKVIITVDQTSLSRYYLIGWLLCLPLAIFTYRPLKPNELLA